MMDDADLLRSYVDDRSQDAFTELVTRHLPLVYSCALRRVGRDVHLAEDVTQRVFNDLARKSPQLRGRSPLSGWLFVGTKLASAEIVRKEQRRKAREREASAMQPGALPYHGESDGNGCNTRILVDNLITELKEGDREAVLLRFFNQFSFAEVGAALGTTQEGARKRVERAVEKLRMELRRRGLASTSEALASALAQEPGDDTQQKGRATRVAGIAIAEFAASGAATSLLFPVAKMVTSESFLSAAAVLVFAVFLALQHRTNSRLRDEVARLGEQSSMIKAVQEGNRHLRQALRDAEDQRQSRPSIGITEKASAPEGSGSPAPALDLVVTSEGLIKWERTPVTLSEFLDRLVAYQAQRPGAEGRLVVHGEPGAEFSATAYVVEQASKAGIQDIAIDTQAKPPASSNWISAFNQKPSPDDSPPPSLPDPEQKH
jgi:RNA polymerase sigma factor (sigma-70 family)